MERLLVSVMAWTFTLAALIVGLIVAVRLAHHFPAGW